MKQQINLYQPVLHERKVPLSATMAAGILAAALLIALLAGLVGMWRGTALQDDLQHLQSRQSEIMQRIDEFKRLYPPKTPDVALVARVERMMQARQARITLLQLLTEKQPGNSQGFSTNLEGLAREDLTTVWLRRIRFTAGGRELLLEGSTTRAEDVPVYLQRLTRQRDYTGREFEHLQLARSESDARVIDFALQTTQEDQP